MKKSWMERLLQEEAVSLRTHHAFVFMEQIHTESGLWLGFLVGRSFKLQGGKGTAKVFRDHTKEKQVGEEAYVQIHRAGEKLSTLCP